MLQCFQCKYSKIMKSTLLCSKLKLQYCEWKDDIQYIKVNGYQESESMNFDNNCKEFKRSFRSRIVEKMFWLKLKKGKPRYVTSTLDHFNEPGFIEERIRRLEKDEDE